MKTHLQHLIRLVSFVCIIRLSFGTCFGERFLSKISLPLAIVLRMLVMSQVSLAKNVAPRINGYYQETHFCDNLLWVEILARYWKLSARTPGRGDTTTLPSKVTGNTWAWGGAEAASGTDRPSGVTGPIPNLLTQVQEIWRKILRGKRHSMQSGRGPTISWSEGVRTAGGRGRSRRGQDCDDRSRESWRTTPAHFQHAKDGRYPGRKIGGRCRRRCRQWVFGFF